MRKRTDVAETLRQRVISGRRFGTLAADGRLPSARALAAELDVDPRVVVAAYRALEREGLVERRPPSRAHYVAGTGTGGMPRTAAGGLPSGGAAADGAARGTAPPTAAAPRIDEWLVGVLAEALERDLAIPAFPEHAYRAVDSVRLRAACVAGNRDHLTWLCRELAEDYGIEAAGVEAADAEALLAAWDAAAREADGPDGGPPRVAARAPRPPALPAALRGADLLVTTRAHADAGRALAARLERPCVVVAQRADLAREVERRLAAGPVYFVGTDPRFAVALHAWFAGSPHAAHVCPVILDADAPDDARAGALAAVPDGAPAYVMRTARDRLGGVPARLHVLSTLRAFSRETREALLRLLVARNLAAHASAAPATA